MIKTISGPIRIPRRIGIYGPPGVGKTSLIASIPNVILIDADKGSDVVDVPRYQFHDGTDGHVPRSYEDVRGAIKALSSEKHDFRNLAIDTLDAVEMLCVDHIMRRDGVDNIEAYGYGKGYQIAFDEFRLLLHDLEHLQATRGMNVFVTCHSAVVKFQNPMGVDWDRYQLKVGKKSSEYVYSWLHELGFYHYVEAAAAPQPGVAAKSGVKAKGWSTGKRVIEFDRSAAWDAKARLPLPSQISIGRDGNLWGPIGEAMERAFSASAEEVIAMIDQQIERIGDPELAAKVRKAVEASGKKIPTLHNYLSDLRRRPAVKEIAATTATTEGTVNP